MGPKTLAATILPVLASAGVLKLGAAPAASVPSVSIPIATATATSISSPSEIASSTILYGENIEIREAPPVDLAILSSTTTIPIALARAVPVATSHVTPAAVALQGSDSTTVQWVETYIGTLHTWVPITITMHFAAVPSQGAQAGKGVVGMGTLTGETGKTKTVIAGAAPTLGAGWMGVAVAAGVGLLGV